MATASFGRRNYNNNNRSAGISVHSRLGQKPGSIGQKFRSNPANAGQTRLFAAAVQPTKPFDARQKLAGRQSFAAKKPQNFGKITDARQKLQQKTKFADARQRIESKKLQTHQQAVSDVRFKLLANRRDDLATAATTANATQLSVGVDLAKAAPMHVTIVGKGRVASESTSGTTTALGGVKKTITTNLASASSKSGGSATGTMHADKVMITTSDDQVKVSSPVFGGGDNMKGACIVRIANDLYQPAAGQQRIETVIGKRVGVARSAGAAESVAARAAVRAASAAAIAPTTKPAPSNSATTSLVGLHRRTQMANASSSSTAAAASSSSAMSPLQGFHTHVSNLHPDVSLDDVMELFGDVGALKNARLIKPGTADVVFVNVDDALTAVKTYNMRLLDGQPMSVEGKFDTSAHRTTTGRSKPVIELEVGILHRALFKTLTDVSHRAPVNFTVQV